MITLSAHELDWRLLTFPWDRLGFLKIENATLHQCFCRRRLRRIKGTILKLTQSLSQPLKHRWGRTNQTFFTGSRHTSSKTNHHWEIDIFDQGARWALCRESGWDSMRTNLADNLFWTSHSSADATTDVIVRPKRSPPPASPTTLPTVVVLFHEFYLADKAFAGTRFIQLCATDTKTAGLILILLSQSSDALMRSTSMGLLAALTAYDLEASNRFLASLST